jgi:transglutaminase-like putative cysteine protease
MTPPGTPVERDLAATLAVFAYSCAVACGFGRVFSGWAFLTDLVVIAAVCHGTSFVLRRLGVSGWIAVPGTAVLLVIVLGLQHAPSTLTWFVPSSETWQLLQAELTLVREQFPTAVAPVPYGAGWAFLAGAGIAGTSLLADTFAFRAQARGETLVPGGVLFVFVAAVRRDRLRVLPAVLLVAAGVVAVVALRALHDRSRRVELVAPGTPRRRAMLAAVGAGAAIAVLAGFVGPRMPGADAEPLFDTTEGRGGVTEVISPMVDIRSRLVDQSPAELFRVDATEPAYWRVTTLPEFDGQTFRLPSRPLQEVDGSFGASAPGTTQNEQDILIRQLGGQLVPAAADPVAASGRDLRWNADTSTLVAVGDELSLGETFTIVSAQPRPTPDELRSAGSASSPDPIHLELPDDFPRGVADLAADVTEGSPSSYDQAIALQTFFQGFRYSTEVQQGHDISAIEGFLRERIGYCEQFSATFAAMARTLDIPSRVAVGFTPGIQAPDGWYSVLGKHAHAWPELWFDGIGWIAFEPTPGRGAPGSESITGLQPQQDTTPATGGAGDGDGPPATAPPATVANPIEDPTNSVPAPNVGADPTGIPPTQASTGGGGIGPVPFVVLGLLAVLAALPAVVRWIRRRARARLGPEQQVFDSWARATAAVRRAGLDGRVSMTPSEWAAATAKRLPVAARPMRSLAAIVDTVAFAPPGELDLAVGPYGVSPAREASAWARQIEEISVDDLSTRERVIRYFTELR